jgi:hypothetical protein
MLGEELVALLDIAQGVYALIQHGHHHPHEILTWPNAASATSVLRPAAGPWLTQPQAPCTGLVHLLNN